MSYEIVYELSWYDLFQHWLIWAMFVPFGLFLFWLRRERRDSAWITINMRLSCIGAVVAGGTMIYLFLPRTIEEYRRHREALANQTCLVVEGEIENVRVEPNHGGRLEDFVFSVDGVYFRQGTFELLHMGYRKPLYSNGLIENGRFARISYVVDRFRNIVLRIEFPVSNEAMSGQTGLRQIMRNIETGDSQFGFFFRHSWVFFVVILFGSYVLFREFYGRPRLMDEAQAKEHARILKIPFYWGVAFILLMGAMVEFGLAFSSDFVSPSNENYYAQAWHLLVALLMLRYIVWIFFQGGADVLARHPALFKAESVSPRYIKLVSVQWALIFLGVEIITRFVM